MPGRAQDLAGHSRKIMTMPSQGLLSAYSTLGSDERRYGDSAIAVLHADSCSALADEVTNVSLRNAFSSAAKFRKEKKLLEQVQEDFRVCKMECMSYSTCFTANMLSRFFTLAGELGSSPGLSSKLLEFYAVELEARFGECPKHVLNQALGEILGIITKDFKGLSGEKWAMNLLAPTIHRDEVAHSDEGKREFIHYLRSQFDRLKEAFGQYKIILWFIEGLRKAANRGKYGFLNFPSLYNAAMGCDDTLGWTVLGWLVVKLHERDGLDIKLFGSGDEEWEFTKVVLHDLPRFMTELANLHSAIDTQIKRSEQLEARFLALLTSAGIVIGQMTVNFLWPICMRLLPESVATFLSS